jgi:FkbM family methyltransferase
MNSRIVRALLHYVYRPGRAYRVPFGPIKGARLYYDRSITYHAMLGFWDTGYFRLLAPVVSALKEDNPELVVCDVGANIGFYSLWFSRAVGSGGRVYAFEPSHTALAHLRPNLSLNGCANVELVEAACCARPGPADFFLGSDHHKSSLHSDWAQGQDVVGPQKVQVQGITLDDFFYGKSPRRGPGLIKMDIEGGGVEALPGCERCILAKRPVFLIESHTPQEDRAISDVLLRHKYSAYRMNRREWVEAPAEVHPHRRGVWGTLLLCPAESEGRFRRLIEKAR